jgi:hypothetical protein
MMKRMLCLLLLTACPGDDDPCGLAAPAAGEAELLTVGDQAFTYASFGAELAGDCPGPDNLRGSVTIAGKQVGTDFPLTFCVREELMVVSGVALDLADGDVVEVYDIAAKDAAGCTYAKDTGAPDLMGTLVFEGFCTEAGSAYDLIVSGSAAGIKTCTTPPSSEPVRLELAGRVSVRMGDGM